MSARVDDQFKALFPLDADFDAADDLPLADEEPKAEKVGTLSAA